MSKIMVSANTVNAASLISACTILLSKEVLGLPVSNEAYMLIPSHLLIPMQSRLKYLKFVVTNDVLY